MNKLVTLKILKQKTTKTIKNKHSWSKDAKENFRIIRLTKN